MRRLRIEGSESRALASGSEGLTFGCFGGCLPFPVRAGEGGCGQASLLFAVGGLQLPTDIGALILSMPGRLEVQAANF